MTERKMTMHYPLRMLQNGKVEPPTDQDDWHVAAMTQGLTTGGGSASPCVVILWERDSDLPGVREAE